MYPGLASIGLRPISAHSCRVVFPTKKVLGAGGMGVGKGIGSGTKGDDGRLRGESVGVGKGSWDGPALSIVSAAVSLTVCSSAISPDSEGCKRDL